MGDCDLNEQGRAFSTILTAIIGSLVNGITNGGLVAFMTGWIAWLAVTRVLTGSIWAMFSSFTDKDLDTDHKRTYEVTFLGWVGWLYTAIYSPIVQALWLAENWDNASGALKIVRALSVAIAALPLTIDTRRRYAEALQEGCLGGVGFVTFILINGLSALGMGVICAALLIKGIMDAGLDTQMMIPICVVYPIFSVVWAAASYRICSVKDGKMRGYGFFADLACGAFAGIFLAWPAIILLTSAQSEQFDDSSKSFYTPQSGVASLQAYLKCSEVAGWQKFVAIFP